MFPRTFIVNLCTLLCILSHSIAYAEDNDVVVFDNADQLTGEFKSLQRGKVRIKSYGASTIYLHWDKVAYVTIDRDMLVETVSGARYFGKVTGSGGAAQVVVLTDSGAVSIEHSEVAKIFPVDNGGLKDLKINVSVGFNFAKANSVRQTNIAADVTQRTTKHIIKARYSSNGSSSAENESSLRRALGGSYSRLRSNRWMTSGTLTFDSNDELDIKLRSSIGAGFGRILKESDHSFFTLQAGLLLTKEQLTDDTDDANSVESYGDMQWDWFKFTEPELDWSSHLRVIPSLTESGRVRGDLNTSLAWKIIGDLKWQLEFYATFDSQPQTEGAEKTDYGVNTSLAYKF